MKFVQADFKGHNPGHYSPGVISHGLLYVSGQLSINPDTREVCTGDIRAHTRQALDNMRRVLDAAGVSRNNVVMCRVYTPSPEYWPRLTKSTQRFLVNTVPPAWWCPRRTCTLGVWSKSSAWLKCPRATTLKTKSHRYICVFLQTKVSQP